MAIVNKDFKIKNGLVVEGASATVNNNQVLTENASDQYILDLIGGETLVKSVSNEFDVSVGGQLSIDRAVVDAYYDPAGAAATAQSNAEDYADGLAVNYDPAGSAATAETNANSYTNTALNDYTPTASLDTTIDGYGYLKSADLSGYATESYVNGEINALNTDAIEEGPGATNQYFTQSRARGAVSDGDGLNYDVNTGVFSAHLGNGLEISGGAIRIDDTVVATETDLTNAINGHDVSTGVHGLSGDVVGTTDTQTISNKTLGSDLAAGGFKITGLATPQNSGDAATKAYVDAVSEGLHVHEAARVAINGNISIASGLENGDTAGGVTLATGNRVLLKDQTVASENGIYVVQASGQALRATDFDTATEVASGDFIFVSEGTYANTGWVQTLNPATIGTDPIQFTQFSGAGTFTAGNGLTLDGTQFKIDESITATRTYVDTEIDAHSDATSGVHGVTGNVVGTSDSQTLTNKALGASTTLSANLDASSNKITNLEDPTSAQDAATKFYVDAAEADANSYTDTGLGLKQDSLTVGDGLDLNGATLNVNSGEMVNKVVNGVSGNSYGIVGNATYLDVTNPTGYNSEIDVDIASLESKLTTDGFASQGDITSAINALDTDDIEEGTTNLYHTTSRAKSAAADLLTGASLTNITITGTGAGLTITAENGVADSDTDDLTEGTSNLYFTDVRAVDALEAVVPNFTAVELNSVAKQVAATVSVATASQVTAFSFAKADYRSAKFLIKTAYGSHTELTEVLMTLDSSDNIAMTEYATVGTNGSTMTITADIDGSNARLRVTTLNNTSVVTVVGTLLA